MWTNGHLSWRWAILKGRPGSLVEPTPLPVFLPSESWGLETLNWFLSGYLLNGISQNNCLQRQPDSPFLITSMWHSSDMSLLSVVTSCWCWSMWPMWAVRVTSSSVWNFRCCWRGARCTRTRATRSAWRWRWRSTSSAAASARSSADTATASRWVSEEGRKEGRKATQLMKWFSTDFPYSTITCTFFSIVSVPDGAKTNARH